MELKPRPSSPTTVTSGVIVQSSLSAGTLPDVGTESAGNSSLKAGAGSSTSPLASTVGQVGTLSDRSKSEHCGAASNSCTVTSAKVASPSLTSVHGKRSPSITTPVKGSSVFGGSTSGIPSPILSPPGKIFGRNNNGISKYIIRYLWLSINT
uniref:Uncharacterized protein n=1 Tax=Anopheles maculatus TaxID=74869 RepID=A0A182T0M8_9DIPT